MHRQTTFVIADGEAPLYPSPLDKPAMPKSCKDLSSLCRAHAQRGRCASDEVKRDWTKSKSVVGGLYRGRPWVRLSVLNVDVRRNPIGLPFLTFCPRCTRTPSNAGTIGSLHLCKADRRNSAEMIPDGEFRYWLRRCFPAAGLGIASILATWIDNDDKRDA